MSIKSADIEKALTELQATVELLKKGDMTAEEALKLYEKGLEQCKTCENILNEKQQHIEICLNQKEIENETDEF